MSAPDSRFVRACRREPTDATPVWFMRQAGRYMPEYRAVRKHHSLLEICRTPALAAEVTITAAEILDVDAAIIFADLLLPLQVMELPFEFAAGEGPTIQKPLRTESDVVALRTDRAADLGYVGESIRAVVRHFGTAMPVIGFCGAPFTLASYMIEGGGSRSYVHTKSMMYRSPQVWNDLMRRLVIVLEEFAADQVRAGADVVQVFDSWAGCLSPEDYVQFVLPPTKALIRSIRRQGVPVIYFGTDTATLLPSIQELGADVVGLDWRISLDQGWAMLGHSCAIQGNLDPVTLFGGPDLIRQRTRSVMEAGGGQPGHIFNVGHGILPETPVENVRAVVDLVREYSRGANAPRAEIPAPMEMQKL